MREAPFGIAIRSSEAPLGMGIQLKQLSIPNCMCLVHPLSMFMMLLFNFATKQIYSMTRRAKRTLGIAIESKQPYIHSELQRAVVFILDVTNVDLQCYDQTNVYGHEARKHISPLCFSNCH